MALDGGVYIPDMCEALRLTPEQYIPLPNPYYISEPEH